MRWWPCVDHVATDQYAAYLGPKNCSSNGQLAGERVEADNEAVTGRWSSPGRASA